MLRFGSGDGQLLRQTLLEGPQFRPCRDAFSSSDFSFIHSSLAILLIRPDQFHTVVEELKNVKLHPFHVVITGSLEYLLCEVLQKLPCRRRPREKPYSRLELNVASSAAASTTSDRIGSGDIARDRKDLGEEETEVIWNVQRTFICLAPQYKDSHTVVQSTTEIVRSVSSGSQSAAHLQPTGYYQHYRGINPRRAA